MLPPAALMLFHGEAWARDILEVESVESPESSDVFRERQWGGPSGQGGVASAGPRALDGGGGSGSEAEAVSSQDSP